MTYFLGVDIGGTKSHAIVADSSGQVLGVGKGGPGNHEGVGISGFRDMLHTVVHQALESAGVEREQITGAGFGIAGYDWPSDHEPHRESVDSLGINAPYQLVNDAIIGLIAGARDGWGVSVVAGTGNNCRGRDASGREGRVAGVGLWTGEHGGGTDLVIQAVQAVWRAWMKLGPETRLTQTFLKYLSVENPLVLIEGLSRGRLHLGSAQALLVFDVAREGDEVARECIRWEGRELGKLAIAVIRQLEFEQLEFEVILTGSLYKGSPLIQEAMGETIYQVAPGAILTPLNAPPVVGGVLLGMEQAGLNHGDVRQNLIENANRLLCGERAGIYYDATS